MSATDITSPPTEGRPPSPVVERPPRPEPRRCLDCGAPLEGKYCVACGQRGQLRSLSLPALAHDAIHDLAHLDSRVWRTLLALLLRPGFLTNEFLAGRRTRYLPPFRLYLVLSIIFFVLLSCQPPEQGLVLGGSAPSGERSGVVSGADPEALRLAMEELSREIARASPSDAGGNGSTSESAASTAAKAAAAISKAATEPDSSVIADADCNRLSWNLLGRTWIEPRLKRVCENLKTVSKREFGRAMYRNMPKMMFLFLPLLALVNLMLYASRRRKYVEHLLFYVHFHAFTFLLLTLQILLVAMLQWVGLRSIGGLVTFAAVSYLFVALFMAMRAVYGQSRPLTTLKYVVVLLAYGVSSFLTLTGTTIYTVLTV